MARLHVRIQPGARRSKLSGWFGELPKFAVAAPPVGGEANAAAVTLIAASLGVPPRSVRLVGGAGSRTKRFEIDGLSHDEIIERLESIVPRPSRTQANPPPTR